MNRAVLCLVALALLFLPFASTASARGRLTIDDNDRIRLPRSVHPLARPEFDRGAVPASLPMERMILSLRIPTDREARLERFLQEQQDPLSANYHRWLSPEEFGTEFGPAPEDISAVTAWLTSHGFRIAERSRAGTWVNFSGTAADVKRAFHTEIHDYRVNGKLHHANATAPEIPRGLSGVVSGVVAMHNFPRRSMLRRASAPAGQSLPDYTYITGAHSLAPGDFAAIYNLNPVYQSGIDGSGQTIAIVGRTHPSSSNWDNFRSSFGLPANPVQVVVNGTDPGDLGPDEDAEADLDVEWAGGVARNATVLLVVSASTGSTDGIDLSAQYVVDHNLAPVMSTSFGSCEAEMSPTENQFFNNLWRQAAAQGITSLVATGDSGAAMCDNPSYSPGTSGAAVNGLASTPYNLAVGGTQFSEGSGTYWKTSNSTDGVSALGYIPETAWNESASQPGGSGLWATGGGASTLYGKPSWQSAPGVPADGWRDLPDVSLSAASHDGYRVRTQGNWSVFGGTSASSPSFAGLMALVVQKTGQRQGNANLRLYQLASAQFRSGGAAVFNDITAGSNSVPGVTGNSCTAAYDLATGLGSVDANALVANWGGAQVPDFSLTAAQAWLAPAPGGAKGTTVTTALTGGFTGDISFTTAGLPVGATATFSPATIGAPGAGSTTLSVTAGSGTPSGSYPITVIASGGGTAHSLTLNLLVRNPGDALFYDGFEAGNFSGWTIEAGSYLRAVSTDRPALGNYAFAQTGGDGVPRDGISHSLPSITPSYLGFYAKSSTTSGAGTYFVIGDDNIDTNLGVIYFSFFFGNLSVYDGTNWITGQAYLADTWYFIEFRNINWAAKSYDFYVNGTLQAAGVPFRSQSTVSLTRLHLYNINNTQAGYDDIYIGRYPPPTVVARSPADGTASVSVAAKATATFSRQIAPSTVTAASFTLRDASGNAVPGAVGYDQGSSTATFTPSAPLNYGTTYTASIAAAQDPAGIPLASPVTWRFSTVPLRTLSAAVTGSGTVNSSPSGIACADGNSGACSGHFTDGTTVTLMPTASNGYQFDTWTGDCTAYSGSNCLVTMTGDRSVAANFSTIWPFNVLGAGVFPSLQDAYYYCSSNCTIQGQEVVLPESWTLVDGKTVFLDGGYTGDFASNPGTTTLLGVLTVQSGTLRVRNLVIR